MQLNFALNLKLILPFTIVSQAVLRRGVSVLVELQLSSRRKFLRVCVCQRFSECLMASPVHIKEPLLSR